MNPNGKETNSTPWHPTPKSRRCYHRVISGIERGGQLRFLTLTSSNLSPDTCQRSFRALYMRLKRRNLMEGYIKVPELSKNGKQHLHVLFRGSYIDQQLISHWWQELHQAKIVDIRKVNYGGSKQRIANYMAKYMSKENAFRYSWNWGWVWRGFCNDWRNLKRRWSVYSQYTCNATFGLLLQYWRYCLRNNICQPLSLLPEPP